MAITDEELIRELVTGGLDERAAQALVDRFAAAVADANRLPVPGSGDAAKVVTVNAGHNGYELDALVDVDHGVAAGGTTGQVYAKASNTDYDAGWVDDTDHSVAAGGTTGQVYAKVSDDDYDAGWVDDVDHDLPAGGTTNSVLAKTADDDFAAAWTDSPTFTDTTVAGELAHSGATAGFYGAAPVAQPVAIADATDAPSVITQLNLLLAAARAEGLIAT